MPCERLLSTIFIRMYSVIASYRNLSLAHNLLQPWAGGRGDWGMGLQSLQWSIAAYDLMIAYKCHCVKHVMHGINDRVFLILLISFRSYVLCIYTIEEACTSLH